MNIFSNYKFLIIIVLNLLFLSSAKSQQEADALWGQFKQYAIENINDDNKSKAINNQIDIISKNIKVIREYPDYYLSQFLEEIVSATEEIKTLLKSESDTVRLQFEQNLIDVIRINTLNHVVLSKTPIDDVERFFRYFNFNLRYSDSNSGKSEIKIHTNRLRFNSTVFSEKSKHVVALDVQSNIEDVEFSKNENDEPVLQGFGGVLIRGTDNSTEVIFIDINQSEMQFNFYGIDPKAENLFIGQFEGSRLNPNVEYKIDKLVVFFKKQDELVYKVKEIGDGNPLWELSTINSDIVDFVTEGDYAISLGKFKSAIARDNIISLDEAKSFIHRGGEHSIGIIFWEEQQLFAFYRCHDDNYAQVLVESENCWIIKAPRKSLPSGFKNSPHFNIGVYKSMKLENSAMTNFDYIMNLIAKKLNNGQQVLYKYSGNIFNDYDEKNIEAIRDRGRYHNYLSNYYQKFKTMFVDNIKGAYYFAYGAGVLATLSALKNKFNAKRLGTVDKRLVKPKLFNELKGFSPRKFYIDALQFGASFAVTSASFWVLTKGIEEYKAYMHGNEMSLDAFLALSDEVKGNRDKTEFLIEVNRDYINIIHSAIIDALVEYNNLEQKRALDISKEKCEKILGINCKDEMTRSLYPEGA